MPRCAICRRREGFNRLYIQHSKYDPRGEYFQAIHAFVCGECSKTDQAPKIFVDLSLVDDYSKKYHKVEIENHSNYISMVKGRDWDNLSTDEKILHVIKKYPGLIQSEIVKFTGLKRTTVTMAIKRIIDSNLCTSEVIGRYTRYYPSQ